MGTVVSSIVVVDDRVRQTTTNSTFIVPSRMTFTVNQMAMMMDAGQQPGIPFSLGDGGIQRPQGNIVKVKYAENTITLNRNSVQLVNEGQGLYSISFTYDATVSSRGIILIGVKDKTTADKIIIDQAVLRWGPFILEPGIKQTWSSKSFNSFVQEKQLPGRCRATPIADIFDIVVSLTPIYNSSTISTPSFSYSNPNSPSSSHLDFNSMINNNNTSIKNDTKTIELTSIDTTRKVKNNVVIPVKNNNSSTNNSITGTIFDSQPVSLLADWTSSWTQSFNMSSVSMDSVDPTSIKVSMVNNPNQIMREVSYIRLTSAGQTVVASAVGQIIPLKCIMQRVQMSGGVYLTQDLYGMDNANNDNNDDNNTTEKPKEMEEANECCICLTDPRDVAVYPCRHMCMCPSCASALPSQGNKCPICRRAVALLLVINNKSKAI